MTVRMWPCNTAPVTSDHLLQHCPRQSTLWKTAWPEDLPLMEKLYGDLAALRTKNGELAALKWTENGDLAALRRTRTWHP